MTLVIFRIIFVFIYALLVYLIWENRYRLGRFMFILLAIILFSLNFYIIYFKALDIEKFFISKFDIRVHEVLTGNEFEAYTVFKNDRQLMLSGTSLPAGTQQQENARLRLEDLLHKQNLKIELLPDMDYSSEPWPVIAYLDGKDVSQLLLDAGDLAGDDTNTAPGEEKTEPQIKERTDIKGKLFRVWVKLPNWLRYPLWIFVGFFCSNSLARFLIFKRTASTLEKRMEANANLIFFLVIFLSAAYSIANSYFNGISIYPPILCLSVTFLMLGFFMKQTREMMGTNENIY